MGNSHNTIYGRLEQEIGRCKILARQVGFSRQEGEQLNYDLKSLGTYIKVGEQALASRDSVGAYYSVENLKRWN